MSIRNSLILFLLITSLLGGCVANNLNQDKQEIKQTTVSYIEIYAEPKNWDSDIEIDGLEMTYKIFDNNDNQVYADGIFSYILYYRTYDKKYNAKRGNVAVNASDITMSTSASDCDYLSCKKRLSINWLGDPTNKYGILEVTLTTPDGKEFHAVDDFVSLG